MATGINSQSNTSSMLGSLFRAAGDMLLGAVWATAGYNAAGTAPPVADAGPDRAAAAVGGSGGMLSPAPPSLPVLGATGRRQSYPDVRGASAGSLAALAGTGRGGGMMSPARRDRGQSTCTTATSTTGGAAATSGLVTSIYAAVARLVGSPTSASYTGGRADGEASSDDETNAEAQRLQQEQAEAEAALRDAIEAGVLGQRAPLDDARATSVERTVARARADAEAQQYAVAAWPRWRRGVHRIATRNVVFHLLVFLMLLVNGVLLIIDASTGSDELDPRAITKYLQDSITVGFAMELLVRLVGLGLAPRYGYFANNFRIFDGLVTILCLVEMVQRRAAQSGVDAVVVQTAAWVVVANVARAGRLLRMARFLEAVPALRVVSASVFIALRRVLAAFLLGVVVTIVFSIFSIEYFRQRMRYRCAAPAWANCSALVERLEWELDADAASGGTGHRAVEGNSTETRTRSASRMLSESSRTTSAAAAWTAPWFGPTLPLDGAACVDVAVALPSSAPWPSNASGAPSNVSAASSSAAAPSVALIVDTGAICHNAGPLVQEVAEPLIGAWWAAAMFAPLERYLLDAAATIGDKSVNEDAVAPWMKASSMTRDMVGLASALLRVQAELTDTSPAVHSSWWLMSHPPLPDASPGVEPDTIAPSSASVTPALPAEANHSNGTRSVTQTRQAALSRTATRTTTGAPTPTYAFPAVPAFATRALLETEAAALINNFSMWRRDWNRAYTGAACPFGQVCVAYGNPENGMVDFDALLVTFATIFSVFTSENWTAVMGYGMDTRGTVIVAIVFVAMVMVGTLFVLNLILAVLLDTFTSAFTQLRRQAKRDGRATETLRAMRQIFIASEADGPADAKNGALPAEPDGSAGDKNDAHPVDDTSVGVISAHNDIPLNAAAAHASKPVDFDGVDICQATSAVAPVVRPRSSTSTAATTHFTLASSQNQQRARGRSAIGALAAALRPVIASNSATSSSDTDGDGTDQVAAAAHVRDDGSRSTSAATADGGRSRSTSTVARRGRTRLQRIFDDDDGAAGDMTQHDAEELLGLGGLSGGTGLPTPTATTRRPDNQLALPLLSDTRQKAGLPWVGVVVSSSLAVASTHIVPKTVHGKAAVSCMRRYGVVLRHLLRAHVVTSQVFTLVSALFTLANAVLLACVWQDMPDHTRHVISITTTALAAFFLLETLLKVMAVSLRRLARDPLNVLDMLVTVGSVIEFVLVGSTMVTLFRALRLFRLLQLVSASFDKTLKQLLSGLRTSVSVYVVLVFVAFIFAVLGMTFFGGELCVPRVQPDGSDDPTAVALRQSSPWCEDVSEPGIQALAQHSGSTLDMARVRGAYVNPLNFDTFGAALLTVFVIVASDGWRDAMTLCMARTSEWAALYFVAAFAIGGYLMLNLIVAVILESEGRGGGEGDDDDGVAAVDGGSAEGNSDDEDAAEMMLGRLSNANSSLGLVGAKQQLFLTRDEAVEKLTASSSRRDSVGRVRGKGSGGLIAAASPLPANRRSSKHQSRLPQQQPVQAPTTATTSILATLWDRLWGGTGTAASSAARSASAADDAPASPLKSGASRATFASANTTSSANLNDRASGAARPSWLPFGAAASSQSFVSPSGPEVQTVQCANAALRRVSLQGDDTYDMVDDLTAATPLVPPSRTTQPPEASAAILIDDSGNDMTEVFLTDDDPASRGDAQQHSTTRLQRLGQSLKDMAQRALLGDEVDDLWSSDDEDTTASGGSERERREGLAAPRRKPSSLMVALCRMLGVDPHELTAFDRALLRPHLESMREARLAELDKALPRRWCGMVLKSPVYQGLVYLTTLFSAASYAVVADAFAAPHTRSVRFLAVTEAVCAGIFTLDILLSITSMGFFVRERGLVPFAPSRTSAARIGHFNIGVNILLFAVTALSVAVAALSTESMSGTVSLQSISVMRIFTRGLRPWLLAYRAERTGLMIRALMLATRRLRNVGVISGLCWALFAIGGTNLFAGRLSACSSTSSALLSWGDMTYRPFDALTTKQACLDAGGYWLPPAANFDQLGESIKTLMGFATTDNWITTMYLTMIAAPDNNSAPGSEHSNAWVAIFSLVFIALAAWFLLNVFLSVMVTSYFATMRQFERNLRHSMLLSSSAIDALDPRQRDFSDMYRRALGFVRAPPTIQLTQTAHVRNAVRVVVRSRAYGLIYFMIVLANVAVQITPYWSTPPIKTSVLLPLDLATISVLSLMLAASVVGSGFVTVRQEFAWVVPEAICFGIVLLCGAASYILEALRSDMSASTYVNTLATLNALRALRMVSLYRITTVMDSMRVLVATIQRSRDSFLAASILVLLTFYTFALVGYAAFGRVSWNTGGAVGRYAHFGDISLGLVVLLRVATYDDWQSLMWSCAVTAPPNCTPELGDCGTSWLAVAFFYLFILLGQWIMLNVYVAILLEAFAESDRHERFRIQHTHVRKFQSLWKLTCRRAHPQIAGSAFSGASPMPITVLPLFLCRLGAPVGPVAFEPATVPGSLSDGRRRSRAGTVDDQPSWWATLKRAFGDAHLGFTSALKLPDGRAADAAVSLVPRYASHADAERLLLQLHLPLILAAPYAGATPVLCAQQFSVFDALVRHYYGSPLPRTTDGALRRLLLSVFAFTPRAIAAAARQQQHAAATLVAAPEVDAERQRERALEAASTTSAAGPAAPGSLPTQLNNAGAPVAATSDNSPGSEIASLSVATLMLIMRMQARFRGRKERRRILQERAEASARADSCETSGQGNVGDSPSHPAPRSAGSPSEAAVAVETAEELDGAGPGALPGGNAPAPAPSRLQQLVEQRLAAERVARSAGVKRIRRRHSSAAGTTRGAAAAAAAAVASALPTAAVLPARTSDNQ